MWLEYAKKVSWDIVLKKFESQTNNYTNTDDWARNLLCLSNEKFKYWAETELTTEDAKQIIILPHHMHNYKKAVIPMKGMLLGEAVEMIKNNKNFVYEFKNCFESVLYWQNHDLGYLFFTDGIADEKEASYKDLKYRKDLLVHIDGLHRLLSLIYPKERSLMLKCFVATNNKQFS